MAIESLPPLTVVAGINAFRKGLARTSVPINTQSLFEDVTRFHAPAGELTSTEQFYVQGGKEIHQPTNAAGGNDNIESDAFCTAQKTSFGDRNSFSDKGDMKATGEALDGGMISVMLHEQMRQACSVFCVYFCQSFRGCLPEFVLVAFVGIVCS